MTLLTFMFNAPVCGIATRTPTIVHAVELDAMPYPWPNRQPLAVCGKKVRYLAHKDDPCPALWPPAIAGLRTLGWTRCDSCFAEGSKKRPRSDIRKPAGD